MVYKIIKLFFWLELGSVIRVKGYFSNVLGFGNYLFVERCFYCSGICLNGI